jgi:hypothetical protein
MNAWDFFMLSLRLPASLREALPAGDRRYHRLWRDEPARLALGDSHSGRVPDMRM